MTKFTEIQKKAFSQALNIALDGNNTACFEKKELNDLSKSIELDRELTNKQIELLIELIDWNIEMVDIVLENEDFFDYYEFTDVKEVAQFRQELESIKA